MTRFKNNLEALEKISKKMERLEQQKSDVELSLSDTQKRLRHRHVLAPKTQRRLTSLSERLKTKGKNLKEKIKQMRRSFDKRRGKMAKAARTPNVRWLDGRTAVLSYELAQPLFIFPAESLYDYIRGKAEMLWKSGKKRREAKGKRLMGIQLVFVGDPTEDGQQEYPLTVSTFEEIPEMVGRVANKHMAKEKDGKKKFESPTEIFLVRIEFLVTSPSAEGGCRSKKAKKLVMVSNQECWEMRTPKSSNNNCGIGCLVLHKQLSKPSEKVPRPHVIRSRLGIKKGEKLKPEELLPIAKDLGYKGFKVMDETYKIREIGAKDEKGPTLWLCGEHYWLAEEVTKERKEESMNECANCGVKYKKLHAESTCIRRQGFRAHAFLRKEYVIIHKGKVEKDFWGIFFDIETINERFSDSEVMTKKREDGTSYTEAEGILKPYAIGWLDNKENVYQMAKGKQCMDNFMAMVKNVKCVGEGRKRQKPTYVGFNNSGFDNQFLLRGLLKHEIQPTRLIINNGRIICLEWENGRVFDLCNFVMCSLKSACKSFDVPKELSKGDFDHTKIESWEDVRRYEREWKPYLENDVLALEEIFKRFQKGMERDFGVSPSQYITLPQMSYSIWTSTLEKLIELPSEEKIEFINRAVYGGRCQPFQKGYVSGSYMDVMEDWNRVRQKYERLKKSYGDNKRGLKVAVKKDREFDRMRWWYDIVYKRRDFVFAADAKSLYPSSFVGVPEINVKVRYPIGESTWSSKPKMVFEKGYLGIFEITWKSPKNQYLPVLPTKTAFGLEWKLGEGRGFYTNVDINSAIECGYKVKFVGDCLYYKKSSSTIFTSYIQKVFKGKQKAEEEGDSVKRTIHKLLANSLYGKVLANAPKDTTSIIRNSNELLEFYTSHHLKNFSMLEGENSNHIVVSGVPHENVKKSRKPKSLGAFVLSYSRKIMLEYFKGLSEDLSDIDHCYTTDTDSIYTDGEGYDILMKKKYIQEGKLGLLTNDEDDNGLVLKMKCLAPKMYSKVVINDLGVVEVVMKCKGIANKLLEEDWYWKEEEHKVSWCGIKRAGRHLTKKQRARGVKAFDMLSQFYSRTFQPEWSKMTLVDNVFVPKGYQGERYEVSEPQK